MKYKYKIQLYYNITSIKILSNFLRTKSDNKDINKNGLCDRVECYIKSSVSRQSAISNI